MSEILRIKVAMPAVLRESREVLPEAMKTAAIIQPSEPLDVLGVPFGGPYEGKDADGEYFSKVTDIWLQPGDVVPVTYYHGLGPDKPGTIQPRPAIIGKAIYQTSNDAGHDFEVTIDLAQPLGQRIQTALDSGGDVKASTGAPGHLVRTKDDGEITVWPVAELALLDVNDWRRPANDYAVVKRREAQAQAAGEAAKAEGKGVVDNGAVSRKNKEIEDMEENKEAKVETPAVKAEKPTGIGEDALKAALKSAMKAQEEKMKEMIDEALKAALDAPPNTPKPAAGAAKAFSINTGEYKAEFDKFLHRDKSARVKATLTDASLGTAAVPVEYGNILLQNLQEASYARISGARVVTQTTLTAKWPKMTYGSAAVLTAEGGSYSEVEPTTAEITATLYKYTRIAKASEELVNDSRFDVWNAILSPDYSYAYVQAENTAFTTGTGSSQPEGAAANATVGVTAAATTAITADEIIELFHALNHLYRRNAVWWMNDATALLVRKLKDSYGRYLWTDGLREGTPSILLGRPVITNQSMATAAAAAKTILFGDFGYYWIFQGTGSAVQVLNELYAVNGLVGYKMFRRFDGHIMNTNAFTVLQQAAA